MKKIFLFLFLFLFLSLIFNFCLFSQDAVITDLSSDSKLYGGKYFPIFIGSEWNWEVKGKERTMNMEWKIISKHNINDPQNNLKDTTGFKVKVLFKQNDKTIDELSSELFIIITDGFIINYEKSDKTYKLEKIIPIEPKIGMSWDFGGTKYKITEINDNSVKVESSNEALDKFGYQLFIKNTGPFEIYEFSPKSNDETFITLLKSTSFKGTSNETAAAVKEETTAPIPVAPVVTSEKTDIETPKKMENTNTDPAKKNDDNKDFYIKTLSSSKKYLQLGAFNMNYYAEDFVKKLTGLGYTSKIYLDSDGFFKVLLETDNPDALKKELKEKNGLNSFIKK